MKRIAIQGLSEKGVISKCKHYPHKYKQLMHIRPKEAEATVITGWRTKAFLKNKTMNII